MDLFKYPHFLKLCWDMLRIETNKIQRAEFDLKRFTACLTDILDYIVDNKLIERGSASVEEYGGLIIREYVESWRVLIPFLSPDKIPPPLMRRLLRTVEALEDYVDSRNGLEDEEGTDNRDGGEDCDNYDDDVRDDDDGVDIAAETVGDDDVDVSGADTAGIDAKADVVVFNAVSGDDVESDDKSAFVDVGDGDDSDNTADGYAVYVKVNVDGDNENVYVDAGDSDNSGDVDDNSKDFALDTDRAKLEIPKQSSEIAGHVPDEIPDVDSIRSDLSKIVLSKVKEHDDDDENVDNNAGNACLYEHRQGDQGVEDGNDDNEDVDDGCDDLTEEESAQVESPLQFTYPDCIIWPGVPESFGGLILLIFAFVNPISKEDFILAELEDE